jgi:hypothetical protein
VRAVEWVSRALPNRAGSSATAATPGPVFSLCVDASTARARRRVDGLTRLGWPVPWCVKAVAEVARARRTRALSESHSRAQKNDDDDEDDDGMSLAAPGGDVMVEAAAWLRTHAPDPSV